MSGVTCCSRLLGCSYLSPWVLPKPWVHTEHLCSRDEFLILGNRALFERVSHQEAVCTVQAVRDPGAAAKKLCTLAQSYGCKDNIEALVVSLRIGEDSCTCEPPSSTTSSSAPDPRCPPPASAPVSVASGSTSSDAAATLSSSSGVVSEFSSETSASEVGSEAGSTASDEHSARPERRCSLHPASTLCGILMPGSAGGGAHPGLFQRQPSSATFSSNQSDNGLDSDDEAPLEGVISNGSRLEVEVDIHCCAFQLRSECPKDLSLETRGCDYTNGKTRRQSSVVVSATNGCLLAVCGREIVDLKKSPSTFSLFGKKLSNGSVVAPEDSHNIIEVALEAPKKKSGYFTAPAQQDPEDQLIVPPSLEQEVREQLRGQAPLVPGPIQPNPTYLKDSVWDHPHPPAFATSLVPGPGPVPILQHEVYDTAL